MTGARVLLIGISDSTGEVNSPSVERDQKVLSAHGCDAKVIITAIKHTNDETEPGEYFPIPTKFVENQIDAALKSSEIEVVKISTYYIHDLENTILSISKSRPGLITVVDASKPLLRDEKALESLNSETTVTVQNQFVVQPGGVSVPYSSQSPVAASSLATAIAANLANRKQVPVAVREAIDYIQNCEKATEPGAELNYFHSTYKLPFGPGQFVPYLLQRPDVQEAWKRHTEHEFLARLADGTLPLEAFKYYLIQDYLFLIQFARANALAAYKEKDLDKIVRSAEIILHINREMALHLSYCKDFGLEKEDILKVPESQACTAYTRYVLDTGNSEDWFALQIALSPCLIGYGVIARRLYDDPKTVREGNRYWKWIENYVADDYVEAVVLGTELLEKHAQKQSPSRIEELVKIFIHATNMETGFWDMGYGMK